MFTQKEIQQLLSILEDQKIMYIGRQLGTDYLTEVEKARLKSIGVKLDKLYIPYKDPILQSLYFGIISDAIDNPKGATYKDVEDFIRTKQYIPLSTAQQATIRSIKNQYMGDIRAQNGRIFQDVNGIIADSERSNRKAYEKVVRDEIERGIVKKKAVNEISRNIARKTGDWNRDYDRIVQTMSHLAFDEGRAAQYERAGGEDALVFKDVYVNACKNCIRLYLTNGIGSKPKIFKLSELRANGTNIGKKVKDWLPVVGGIHPFCRCSLNYLRDNMEWNDKKGRFEIKKEIKIVGRKPIKITFKGKEYEV